MRSSPEQRLRETGLRVTRPRLAVLEVLEVLEVLDEARREHRHLPVSAIVSGARTRLGGGRRLPHCPRQRAYHGNHLHIASS